MKQGDVVQLKSGGPKMTVVTVNGNDVRCSFFDGQGEMDEGTFPIACLMPAVDLPPPVSESAQYTVNQYITMATKKPTTKPSPHSRRPKL